MSMLSVNFTLSKQSYGCAGISSGDSQEDRAAVKEALASAYKSNLAHKVKAEFQDSGNEFQIASEGKHFDRWMTTWLQQFTVLLRRCVKERRHESFSAPRVARILVLALFAGFLWWQSGPANIQDQVSDTFFPFSILIILSMVLLFLSESKNINLKQEMKYNVCVMESISNYLPPQIGMH